MGKYEKRVYKIKTHGIECKCDCGHQSYEHDTGWNWRSFSHNMDTYCNECTCTHFQCRVKQNE